jgi:hypothetical protein
MYLRRLTCFGLQDFIRCIKYPYTVKTRGVAGGLHVKKYFFTINKMNCYDEEGNMVNMSEWSTCSVCVSDDYIVREIPHTHWAYRLFKTRSREVMKQHEKSKEHLEHFKEFRCEACKMQFYNRKELEAHQHKLFHKRNAKVDHICQACDMSFEFPSQLEAHLETQKHKEKQAGTKQDLYYCKECDFETKFKSQWNVHIGTKKHKLAVGEIEEKEIHYCPECDYTTKYKSQWEIHCNTSRHKIGVGEMKAFAKPEMYRCELCDYETTIKQVFDKHNLSKKHTMKYIEKNEKNN